MNKSLIFLALLTCCCTASSNSVYTAKELHDLVVSGNYPETLRPHLIIDSVDFKSFDECVSRMKSIQNEFSEYPSVIERDSFGLFRAKLWRSDGVYELSCVEANAHIIAEEYKSEYK